MADNPDLGLGLKYLGKLLGVLGDDGPNWAWFGDPGKETLKSLRANRNQLARVIAALRWGKDLQEPSGDPDKNVRKFPKADSSKNLRWESLYKDQDASPKFETGVVWNEGGAGDPLQIGIGAVVDTSPVDLDILLWLVREATDGKLDHRFGTGFVQGEITISDAFLSKISSGIELTRQGNNLADTKVLASIGVTEPAAPNPVTKTVTLDTSNPNLEMLGWDLSRIGAFIVGAWLRREAAKPANAGTAWERLGKHVLPLFGGPGAGPTPNPIQPLPPFQEPGTPANPTQWHQSLIAPISGGNTDAAERFLWHARALLTGKEATGGLFSGSVYLQIDPPPPGGQPLLDQAGQLLFTDEGALPANPAQTTRYLGALWTGQAPPPLQLIHRQRTAAGADTDATLFDFDANGLKKAEANFKALSGGAIPLDLVFTTDGGEPVLSLVLDPSVTLMLGIGKKPWLKLKTPRFPAGVEFSKDPARGAIELLLALVGLLPPEVKDNIKPWLEGVANLLDVKDPAKVASGVAGLVSAALRAAVGPEIKLISVGPLTLSLKIPPSGPPEAWINFKFQPKDALADTVGIYIGELNTGVGVGLPLDGTAPSVKNGSFELKDVRATPGQGVVGFIAELLPDFLKLAGFDLKVTWAPVAISGGGRIPIQSSTAGGEGTSIGPINLRSIDVAIKNNTTLSIGL
ncbi:MAG TPA: hypothetical protein VFB81_01540, partial [Myxococcales bacterium]|nr:hypothetical protein [Myxococcales bacterium]